MDFSEISLFDRPHYRVQTNSATYVYDPAGGGFARLIDPDGQDWINFFPEPLGEFPTSANSGFRGIPNLVHGCDDAGVGHPGHLKCVSFLNVEENTIYSESINGNWQWKWSFSENFALFKMLKIPAGARWWFLYEGTPAGLFDPENTMVTCTPDQKWSELPGIHTQSFFEASHFQVTHSSSSYCLSLEKLDGAATANYWWMGDANKADWSGSKNGMIVFGFGREKDPVLKALHSFRIQLKSIKR